MIYSNEEIELILNLYSIAKSHINELIYIRVYW